MNKLRRRLAAVLFCLGFSLAFLGQPGGLLYSSRAMAYGRSLTIAQLITIPGSGVQSALPTVEQGGAILPDWNQITFSTLPSVQADGVFQATPDIVQALGYDPSRSWQAGDPLAQVLSLGDVQDAFGLEQFNLAAIASLTGLDLGQVSLENLGPAHWQSVASLVRAIPGLEQFPVEHVAPVFDLLSAHGIEIPYGEILGEIAADPVAGALQLADIDLSRYGLDAIPGLENVQLGNLANWQEALISEIPGLSEVPFSEFVAPLLNGEWVIGLVDVVYGEQEADRLNVISGGLHTEQQRQPQLTQVPCEQDSCAHIELADPLGMSQVTAGAGFGLLGKQWISGRSQTVHGGFGPLAFVNGGQEPTGRHPFGNTFKVVLESVDEAAGRADFSIYFRICKHIPFIGKSCTPYFIGPFPWLTHYEEDPIFLGIPDFNQGDAGKAKDKDQAAASDQKSNDKSDGINPDALNMGENQTETAQPQTPAQKKKSSIFGGAFENVKVSDVLGTAGLLGAAGLGSKIFRRQMGGAWNWIRKGAGLYQAGQGLFNAVKSGKSGLGSLLGTVGSIAGTGVIGKALGSRMNKVFGVALRGAGLFQTGQKLFNGVKSGNWGQMLKGGGALAASGLGSVLGSRVNKLFSLGMRGASIFQNGQKLFNLAKSGASWQGLLKVAAPLAGIAGAGSLLRGRIGKVFSGGLKAASLLQAGQRLSSLFKTGSGLRNLLGVAGSVAGVAGLGAFRRRIGRGLKSLTQGARLFSGGRKALGGLTRLFRLGGFQRGN